jgi:hypothetical protein
MNPVLTWTFLVAAIILTIAGVIALLVYGSAWLEPRVKRVNQGFKPVKGHLPCCPPGLGCNDPDKDSKQHCLRKEARRIATVEELIQLDRAWSDYCGIKTKKRKDKATAHGNYSFQRDSIIARALNDVADSLNQSRALQLPQHINSNGSAMKGQVV